MPTAKSRPTDAHVRRLALRNGYYLRKARGQLSNDNRGLYRIVDPELNAIMAGEKFDMNIAEVESWLNRHANGRLAGLLKH